MIEPESSSALHDAHAALAGHAAPEALLFDLDGTLIDSVDDIHAATNALLSELGFALRRREEIAHWVGNGARMLVERAMAGRLEGFDGLPDARERHAEADAAMPRFRAIYERACMGHTRPLPGAGEVLAFARRRRLPVAIVTNKPLVPTGRIIDALGWRSAIDVVIAGDSLPVRKPDPAPVREAMRRLARRHGWMIGDSANDVGAARAAGMPSLVVRGGYNHGRPAEELDPRPEVILGSLVEVPMLVVRRLEAALS